LRLYATPKMRPDRYRGGVQAPRFHSSLVPIESCRLQIRMPCLPMRKDSRPIKLLPLPAEMQPFFCMITLQESLSSGSVALIHRGSFRRRMYRRKRVSKRSIPLPIKIGGKPMKEASFEGVVGLNIFTRPWRPAVGPPRAVVLIVHGFNSHRYGTSDSRPPAFGLP
jgi:hypothetical protein